MKLQGKEGSLKGIFKGDRKKLALIIFLLALGLLLVSLSSFFSKGGEQEESGSLKEYKETVEKELEEVCSSVKGVGKCRVTVTFNTEGIESGDKLTELPSVSGITVVCKGGDSDEVKSVLTQMLSSLYGIGANRISVLKLNS